MHRSPDYGRVHSFIPNYQVVSDVSAELDAYVQAVDELRLTKSGLATVADIYRADFGLNADAVQGIWRSGGYSLETSQRTRQIDSAMLMTRLQPHSKALVVPAYHNFQTSILIKKFVVRLLMPKDGYCSRVNH